MPTLFISDLHLDAKRPAITESFLDFLAGQAARAGALYILGDLFEAWIGDDDNSRLAQQVAAGISLLTATGVPVFFIHGNRDFLLGERYAQRCGMQLLAEHQVVDIEGQPTLLMHGDTLCTDDVEYQAVRVKLRSPGWQRKMSRLPLFVRRLIARRMRRASAKAVRRKSATITDVNDEAVLAALRRYGVRRLIHGHTHRPAIHELRLDGQPARRIVLGDWYEQGSVLICEGAECRLTGL